ncbi:uncharacterized protein LOC131859146 [Cryptomeria japonica]|uniref:uncharacterized protein LOC131859146 n=1 Tax=Cryptomeria japonica TaxID=3369 RepID=UPI0027DA9B23|nr:uncharacterized protein LOC131859146 [Cryptomeria japonica]
MQCTSTKATWDKLQSIYEGDAKVKEAKLQNLRAQFENLKMKDEEKIADYLQRVDETMSAIRGLGEEVSDGVIVKKVMRSLTPNYDTKVPSIEEAKDLKTFSMDELFGSPSAYEMRTRSVEPSKREAAFNITKKGKEEVAHEEVEEDSNAVVIGNFASKCPHGEKDENGKKTMKSFGKEKMTNSYKPRRRSFWNKSSLYTFEDDASDEESFSDDWCSEVNFFMAQGELFDEHIVDDEEEEIEAEVDLEGELVSALEELRKVRREYKKHKNVVAEEQELLIKSLEESKKTISNLKIQLEEEKRMYEVTKSNLERKVKEYQQLEEEIVSLRKELEKCKNELNMRITYDGSIEELDKMISKQKHSKDTEGVGFEVGQSSNSKDSSNKEILFTSSSGSEVKQTFIVSKPNEKKTYAAAKKNQSRNQHASMRIQKEKPRWMMEVSQESRI